MKDEGKHLYETKKNEVNEIQRIREVPSYFLC